MINKKAFTFVELMVVITILAVLGAIGFSSYISSIADTRDSQRKSDFAQVSSALKIYKQKRGYYSHPGDVMNIQYAGNTVALQGKLNINVRLNSLDKLPSDPETKEPYFYSITKNKQEFELAGTLENTDTPLALMIGNYKSVSKSTLPVLNLAMPTVVGSNIEIKDGVGAGTANRKRFIYDNQSNNLPYEFVEPFNPYSDGTDFNTLQGNVEFTKSYWQNTDFRNCIEIQEAGKALIPFTSSADIIYQIIDNVGNLSDIGCTS